MTYELSSERATVCGQELQLLDIVWSECFTLCHLTECRMLERLRRVECVISTFRDVPSDDFVMIVYGFCYYA